MKKVYKNSKLTCLTFPHNCQSWICSSVRAAVPLENHRICYGSVRLPVFFGGPFQPGIVKFILMRYIALAASAVSPHESLLQSSCETCILSVFCTGPRYAWRLLKADVHRLKAFHMCSYCGRPFFEASHHEFSGFICEAYVGEGLFPPGRHGAKDLGRTLALSHGTWLACSQRSQYTMLSGQH